MKPVLIAGSSVSGRVHHSATASVVTTFSLDPLLLAQIGALRDRVRQLDDEVQTMHTAIAKEKLHIVDGYIISIRPDLDSGFIARCPTLHAVAQGETVDEAAASLRDAMETSMDGRRSSGSRIPVRDTEKTWLA